MNDHAHDVGVLVVLSVKLIDVPELTVTAEAVNAATGFAVTVIGKFAGVPLPQLFCPYTERFPVVPVVKSKVIVFVPVVTLPAAVPS